MNEIYVHVTGVVATDVSTRTVDDVMVSSFRMVSTTRKFDRAARTWVDGDKTWLTVTCWRHLANNVGKCVLKSERVVVTGRLKVSEWRDAEGNPRTRTEIVADAVGHDLTFGTTVLTRAPRVASVPPDEKELAAAELAAEQELLTEGIDVDALLAGVLEAGEGSSEESSEGSSEESGAESGIDDGGGSGGVADAEARHTSSSEDFGDEPGEAPEDGVFAVVHAAEDREPVPAGGRRRR